MGVDYGMVDDKDLCKCEEPQPMTVVCIPGYFLEVCYSCGGIVTEIGA